MYFLIHMNRHDQTESAFFCLYVFYIKDDSYFRLFVMAAAVDDVCMETAKYCPVIRQSLVITFAFP